MSVLTHEAFVYDSDTAYVESLAPFVESGVAEGDDVVVVSRASNCDLLRDALAGAAERVRFIDAAEWYEHPVRTIAAYHRMLRASSAQGAPRARVVGEVEFGATAREQAEWARYESVLNRALAGRPAWIVCPYDARRLPDAVLESAVRTHPHVLTGGGATPSHDFVEPDLFVGALPIEPGVLVETLALDGSPAPARALVVRTADAFGIPADRVPELCVAVSELATNAIVHGDAPRALSVYRRDSQVVYEVRDAGPGLGDPFAGFLPPSTTSHGGAGLWISRQLADRLEIHAGDPGTVARLVVSTA